MAGARVLLVDDDADICHFLATLLELEGLEPVIVSSAEEALPALPSAAAVLLDVAMPRIDGLELCRRMRASGFAGPILVVSARPGADLPARAVAAGASGFIRKPFDNADLVGRLQALLGPSTPAGG